MLTKLIRMADTDSVMQKIKKVQVPTDVDLKDAIIKELTKGYLFYTQKEESQPITIGNKVTLKIASNIPKFNKDKVSINVGSRLYSEIVENALIGLKVGATETVVISGEKIEFTVLKTEELCYPEPTNDMVAEKNIEGIETVKQFKEYYLAQKQSEIVNAYAQACLDELIEQSEFTEINQLDIKEVIDQQFNVLRERFLHSELDLEKLSEEEWIQNFYNPDKYPFYKKIYPDIALLMRVRNKKEFYDSLYTEGVNAIRIYLVLSHFFGKENSDEFNPTKSFQGERKLMDEYVQKIKEYLIQKEGC